MHQVDCLGEFLRAIPWSPIAETIPFKLHTHLSDSDPSERDRLPVTRQREEIERVLGETKGRVGGAEGAAARLGIKRTTLLARMKKLGIDPKQFS